MKPIFFALLLSLPCWGFSQKEYNNWVFGTNCLLSFNSGQPVVSNSPALKTLEGCSSISDAAGNLLFYTNGVLVYDSTNTLMPNGSGLLGNYSSAQSSLIVPYPGHSNLYYIFTSDALENDFQNGYCYSIVDMSLNNGKGDVTSTKNVLLYLSGTEKLAAVVNATGTGYWIATHHLGSNSFVCYELTSAGLSAPVTSETGRSLSTIFNGMGYMQFSNNNTMLAMPVYEYYFSDIHNYTGNELDVLDFDNATGKVTYRYNLLQPPTFISAYGVAFSPDDTKLYITGDGDSALVQFNLSAGSGDSVSVIASKKIIETEVRHIGAILLGPDNRLYIAQCTLPYLGVIAYPNLADTACKYIKKGIDLLTGQSDFGLPNLPTRKLAAPNQCALPQLKLTAPKTNLCSGDSLPVCAGGTYTTYLWSNNSTGSCIQAKQAGTYFVTVRDGNNCPGRSDTVTILVNAAPQPVVMADKTIFCADDSAAVCTTNPFVNYSWNVGGNTSCVQAKQAGDYYVTVTDANGCTAQSSHVSMNVHPVSSVSIIETGDTLSSYGQPGYQWYLNGNPITGATQPQYVAHTSGSYSLQVTDTNNCTVQSQPVIITTTGLTELTESVIEVYPNPSSVGSVQLAVSNEYIGSKLEVYDSEGRLVFHSEISNQKSAIDLPLSKGVYYLQISGDNTKMVRKLVRL